MAISVMRIETKKLTLQMTKLIKMVISNHDNAKQVLREGNKEMALKVIDQDNKIDVKYAEIESDLEFLITKGPVDKNLRRTLAGLHIAREIARVGDYAKHIAKFVIKNEKLSLSSIKRIDSVHKAFRAMLLNLDPLIKSESIDKAEELVNMDDVVDELVKDVRKKIIASIAGKRDQKKIRERIFVLNVVDALERGADHIVNICEMIIYINTGSHRTYK